MPRRRNRRRNRIVALFLGGAFLAALVVGLLCAWQAFQAAGDLRRMADDASALESSLRRGDSDEIDARLAALAESSADAADRTGSWQWSVVTRAPVVGDDARGVQVVTEVVRDIAASGVDGLADVAADLDVLLPRNGRVDLDAVDRVAGPVRAAALSLSEGSQRLDAEDPSGYVGRLRDEYRELQVQVRDAARALDSASIATELLPSMLGAEGAQDFLLVFENNAEIRASAGLPGATAIVHAEEGRLSLRRQVTAGSFGRRQTPLPLTKEERGIYGPQLGTFFLDANFTPDFPRTAELMRQRWEETYPERIAGVLSLDTVSLSYLLDATGPVEVGPYTLTSDNVVDLLLHQVYLDIEEPAAQDEVFQDVARTVFQRLSSGDVRRPRDLLAALVRLGDEDRAAVHLFDDEQQKLIQGRAVAAELDTDKSGSNVEVTLNDTTGAKMSYFLRSEFRGETVSCVDGVQTIKVSGRLRSVAPNDAAALPRYITGGGRYGVDAGSQLVTVRLYTPHGGEVTRLTINNRDFDLPSAELDERRVSTAYPLLAPGETVDVEWTVRTPSVSARELRVTPGVGPGDSSSWIAASC